MKGLTYRTAMTVIAVAALILIFWQAGLLSTHPFAVQKLVLLCVCAVYTLLVVPLITRKLFAPVSIGIWAVTGLFVMACIVIACLKSSAFWVPVIIVIAVYALLQLAILSVLARGKDNTQ